MADSARPRVSRATLDDTAPTSGAGSGVGATRTQCPLYTWPWISNDFYWQMRGRLLIDTDAKRLSVRGRDGGKSAIIATHTPFLSLV